MRSGSTYRVFILLWLITAVYLAFLPTRHYTQDAVNNLTYLEAHNSFESWHSQHLLGLKPGEWLYALTNLRAWQAMRIAQAILGGLTIVLLYLGLEELTSRRWLGIIGALSLCFSYGFWHYSSDPDIYGLGYAAIALLMWTYVRFLKRPTDTGSIILGLSAAIALLSHQINIELAGLIGLSLIFAVIRKRNDLPVTLRQIIIYAGCSLLPTILLYVVAWQSVSASFVQQGLSAPTFVDWLLRYFQSADSGQATWGVSFGLQNLPTAIYTWLSSWTLVPLFGSTPIWQLIPIGLFGVLVLILFIRALYILFSASTVDKYILWIGVFTLVANGISGWWWQTGNIKFYLFMQINVIYLVALYVGKLLKQQPVYRTRELTLPLSVMSLLVLFHLTLTLPYETTGGIFEVADHLKDANQIVAFQDPNQARILPYISPNTTETLSSDFCDESSQTTKATLWVVRQDIIVTCPSLTSATEITRFQVDRTRAKWVLLDMTSALQTK